MSVPSSSPLARSLSPKPPASPSSTAMFNSTFVANYKRCALLCFASVAWMFFSSALILLNKYLMVTDGFRFPMALTAMGMIFSSVASFLVCKVFSSASGSSTHGMTKNLYFTRLMPVGLCLAITLTLGNWVYLYLTVAFIQILKAFTPVVTMGMAFMVGLERPKSSLISSIMMIASGVGLAAYGELSFSAVGLSMMAATQVAESARLIMTQTLMQGLKLSPFEGLMYTAPACLVWLGLGCGLLEYPRMIAGNAFQKLLDKPLLYLSAAAMGFLVNISAYVTLKLSGSLTLKVLATVKNSLIVLFGVLIFGETVSALQLQGYTISVMGFFLYNHSRMASIAQTDPAQSKKADQKADEP